MIIYLRLNIYNQNKKETIILLHLIQEKIYEDLDDGRNESKIAWKIRAQRKRQQKHLTLGLTREEFANIQESLKYRPLEGKYLEFYI